MEIDQTHNASQQAPTNRAKRCTTDTGMEERTDQMKKYQSDAGQRSRLGLGVERMSLNDNPAVDHALLRQTLDAARTHIRAKKAGFEGSFDDHLKSAAGMLGRTLCLASPFNAGTSHLSSFARQPGEGGSYVRSFFHDQFTGYRSDKKKQKTVTDMVAKQDAAIAEKAANSGHIPNVPTYALHNLLKAHRSGSLKEPRSNSSIGGTGELYDKSLAYRTQSAKYVADNLKNLNRLQVRMYNDYPAVMVHFDARTWMGCKNKTELNALEAANTSFNEFLMSHYAGIVNAEAAKRGMSTPMVERSSFGHHTPSVAVTGSSFRINLGMMPPAYAEVHISALRILNAELDTLRQALTKPHGVSLNKIRNSAHFEEIAKAENLLQLAFSRVEVRGLRLISNAVRNLSVKNAVDAESYAAHLAPDIDHGDSLQNALRNLLAKVEVKTDQSTSTSVPPDSYSYDMSGAASRAAAPAPGASAPPAGLAGTYAGYLDAYRAKFERLAHSTPDEATRHHMQALAATLHSGNPDLAGSLDVASHLLMVHTLDKMAVGPTDMPDIDYGSDSDLDDIEDKAGKGIEDLKASKVITHNGMRSLIKATESALQLLTDADEGSTPTVAYAHPYYETPGAIKETVSGLAATKKGGEAAIVIKDINACVTDGKESSSGKGIAEEFPNAKAWIIDTTSATTEKMGEVLNQFKDAPVPGVLYFVSSGLKNEQGGADVNNYGTMRVFVKSGHDASDQQLGEILSNIDNTDKGLARFSHEYRRTMKEMDLVPTNRSIVMASVDAASAMEM
ncbi:hypothetical protein ACZ75_17070 [Massilia sp. NR 4-1]|nr:hypothetical protein ACZ75_17070 [Massilia sp. NR 4-1]